LKTILARFPSGDKQMKIQANAAACLFFMAFLAGPITAGDTSKSNEAKVVPKSKATQAELGIGVSALPPVLTSHLPAVIGQGRGILISEVTEGSPAEKSGLKKNDVLVRYDDQDLYSPEQLVKRVRNDVPGKQVELGYVRAGKLQSVKVTLGEKPKADPVLSDWSGFTKPFDGPMVPYKPDFLTEAEDAEGESTEWTYFQSMSLVKGSDGKYTAKVQYKEEDGTSIDREYTGTRQEVRDAIEQDKSLPSGQRDQLLRSLDDRGEGTFPDFKFPTFPDWAPWNRELFDWPNLNF
jgi:hypothetical protein